MAQTIRQGIIKDSDVGAFWVVLQEAPERILYASDNLEGAEHDLKLFEINYFEQAKDQLQQVELEIAFEIRAEGSHKNEEARKAAIAMQKKDNEEYIKAVNVLAAAKRKKAEMETDVDHKRNQMFYVRNLFQSYCACAEMIAGLCHEQETSEMIESMKNLALTLSQAKEETNHG